MEKLLLDTQNETRSQLPWVMQAASKKKKKKHVCVYDRVSVCICVHSAHIWVLPSVCVCLCSKKEFVFCPRTGNKTPVLPFLVKFFPVFLFSWMQLDPIYFSASTSSENNRCCDVGSGGWIEEAGGSDSAHIKWMFFKLCAGSIPVWICQHDGSWINIFKRFLSRFLWVMSDIKHANTESDHHQMQDDR